MISKKANMFLNILAIAFALIEIVAIVLGPAPSALCAGTAWFCVICWVIVVWIKEYLLEKKDAELAKCENALEDAMKTIDSLRGN